MELVVYVLGLICTFGLGILTTKDRIFGVAGILIGFIFISYLGNDGSVVINATWSETLQVYKTRTIDLTTSLLLMFVFITLNFVMLISEWDKYKKPRYEG